MIDKSRKSLLEKKREEMKIEIERKNRLELISDLTSELDASSTEYHIDFDSVCSEWLEAQLPFTSWGKIDWDQLVNKTFFVDVDVEDAADCMFSLIKDKDLSCSGLVTVIWSNVSRPSITLSLTDVKNNLINIFDEDFDAWVISEEDNWVIEYHHECTLGFSEIEK